MRQLLWNLSGTLLALTCGATVLVAACSDDPPAPLDSEGSGGTTFAVDPGSGGSGRSQNSGGSGDTGGSGGTNSASDSAPLSQNTSGGAGGSCDETSDCGPGGPGERCAEAIEVDETGFKLAGDDFTEDFGHNFTLGEDVSCAFSEIGSSDAVFKVDLERGQELSVTQVGELDATLSIQHSCGPEEECLRTTRNSKDTLRYVADADETLYVVVEAIEEEPDAAQYEIHIDIDGQCGNAIFEAPEACDDGDTDDGDGCSATCAVEFPYECTETSPSECEPYPSMGTWGAEGLLDPIEFEGPFAPPERRFYTVTFTEPLVADLLLESLTEGTGDINAIVWRDWKDGVTTLAGSGSAPDLREHVYFEAGTYLFEFFARTDLPEGFRLTLNLQLLPPCGDMVFDPAVEECDDGNGEEGDGCSATCTIEFGWECSEDSPTLCTEIEDLGEFAAGESIDLVESLTAFPIDTSEYWMIDFSEPVLLSAVAVGVQDVNLNIQYISRLRMLDEAGNLLLDQPPTDGETATIAVVDLPLSPGRYRIEIFTDTGLPEGYTLALSTTAQ